MKQRIILPLAKPTENGDKPCGCCKILYSKDEIRANGHYQYEAYWANCANCYSTLTIRETKEVV